MHGMKKHKCLGDILHLRFVWNSFRWVRFSVHWPSCCLASMIGSVITV